MWMTNLTEISIFTRKLALWIGIGFLTYLLLRIFVALFIVPFLPPKKIQEPPPNILYGKIPQPKFPPATFQSSKFQYSLETVDGTVTEATRAGRVYKMPKKLPSLLASERAKKFAEGLGFVNIPQIQDSSNYIFTGARDPLRSLNLDITSMNFKMGYDYSKKPGMFVTGSIQSKDKVLLTVMDYIKMNHLFDDTYINGKTSFDYLTYNPSTNSFLPATSLSTAQAVRINFFRTDIGTFHVVPPKFSQSYNYAVFTEMNSGQDDIVELAYTFWPIALDDFGTYPLKKSEDAYQDLKDGYAYVVDNGNNSGTVKIRSVYLAYYDSEEPQFYLQPVFVFEGDNGFVAYDPAVVSDLLD